MGWDARPGSRRSSVAFIDGERSADMASTPRSGSKHLSPPSKGVVCRRWEVLSCPVGFETIHTQILCRHCTCWESHWSPVGIETPDGGGSFWSVHRWLG